MNDPKANRQRLIKALRKITLDDGTDLALKKNEAVRELERQDEEFKNLDRRLVWVVNIDKLGVLN